MSLSTERKLTSFRNMFGFLFGWRNASKCKRLVKRVQCRVKLLKSKRYTIVKQLREDMAQLIKIGDEERAFNRADQLYRDENLMSVYELLDHFCEFIIIHLSYIRKNRDLPNDINEAVSSLVFASARCGDLPELCTVRKLFAERYGQRFATVALELLPGNLVNREIKEKLSISSAPDDAKYRLLEEIARDYCLRPEILALEYIPELRKEVKESNCAKQIPGGEIVLFRRATEESINEASKGNDMETKAMDVDIISNSVSPLLLQHSSSDMLESPEHNAVDRQGNISPVDVSNEAETYKFPVTAAAVKESLEAGRIDLPSAGGKLERINQESSPESLRQFNEETFIYLDDIEELESPITKDQRLFKFKSSVKHRRESSNYSFDENSYAGRQHYESLSEKSGSRTSRMTRKRSRRRSSASWENSISKDIESFNYYDKPYKKSPSDKHSSRYERKHQTKSRSKESCYIVYSLFTYPDQYWRKTNDRSKGRGEKTQGSESPGGNASSLKNSHRSKGMAVPPYSRANTMPQERGKETFKESFVRSNSCTYRNPNHVHPKLPEYDDIAAKFMALRKEHEQNKDH